MPRCLLSILGGGKWDKVDYTMHRAGAFKTDYATYAVKSLRERLGVSYDRIIVFGIETSARAKKKQRSKSF